MISVDNGHLSRCLFVDSYFNHKGQKSRKIELLNPSRSSVIKRIEANLRDYFAGHCDICGTLPLLLKGTKFQQLVWQAVLRVSAGQTQSYLNIAKQISKPTASRAVANACAQNNLALFVPCHRIISEQNKTTGYRWNIERALYLLEMEKHYFR
ncbi:MAG: methylated-DNA--[protein]-cysteine S-methyltransferase [Deltaproteobacteria bacterium]|nr:methylated-DNA--[protein]-cysteine S-methyltransferase [Deltaproteobacteria bacterium]